MLTSFLGRIVEFRVHPSNEYLIVLTNDAKLNILKIANGEFKGSIDVKRFSTRNFLHLISVDNFLYSDFVIDPSGLYAIIASHSPLVKSKFDIGLHNLRFYRYINFFTS